MVWMRTKPRFRRFVAQVQDAHPNRPSLESLLITPVQRVPRYSMLLASLLKHTPPGHLDQRELERALQTTKDTARFINIAIREGQSMSKLLQLQDLFASSSSLQLLTTQAPRRRLVFHGSLWRMASDGTYQRCHGFLMSDAALLVVTVVPDAPDNAPRARFAAPSAPSSPARTDTGHRKQTRATAKAKHSNGSASEDANSEDAGRDTDRMGPSSTPPRRTGTNRRGPLQLSQKDIEWFQKWCTGAGAGGNSSASSAKDPQRLPLLVDLCGVADGTVRSKVEEDRRTKAAVLMAPILAGVNPDQAAGDGLEAERQALSKAVGLVAAGFVSEEEFLVLCQRVLDSSADQMSEQEARRFVYVWTLCLPMTSTFYLLLFFLFFFLFCRYFCFAPCRGLVDWCGWLVAAEVSLLFDLHPFCWYFGISTSATALVGN